MAEINSIHKYHEECLRTVQNLNSANKMLVNALLKSEGELGEFFHSPSYPEREEFADCLWYTSLAWKAFNLMSDQYLETTYSREGRRYSAKDYCYELSKVLYDSEGKGLINPSKWSKEKVYFKVNKHFAKCCEYFGKFLFHCDGAKNAQQRRRGYLQQMMSSFHDYECHLFLEAFRHDWPMVELWEENIEKLEDRYPNGFNPDNKQ